MYIGVVCILCVMVTHPPCRVRTDKTELYKMGTQINHNNYDEMCRKSLTSQGHMSQARIT